jgi:glycine cleavage system aminomethyltransferase T
VPNTLLNDGVPAHIARVSLSGEPAYDQRGQRAWALDLGDRLRRGPAPWHRPNTASRRCTCRAQKGIVDRRPRHRQHYHPGGKASADARARHVQLPQRGAGRTFALALVKNGRHRIGGTVLAPLGDRTIAATVTEPLFYDKEGTHRDG